MEICLIIFVSAILAGIYVLVSEPDVDEEAGKKALDEFYRQYGQMDQHVSKYAKHGRLLAVSVLTITIMIILGIIYVI